MFHDPVVAEIRAIREQLAARFNYDVRAIGEYARQRNAEEKNVKVVRLPPRRPANYQQPQTAKADP